MSKELDTIDAAISELARLRAVNVAMLSALKRAQTMCRVAIGQFEWGSLALSPDAVRLLNQVPGEIDAAIRMAGK